MLSSVYISCTKITLRICGSIAAIALIIGSYWIPFSKYRFPLLDKHLGRYAYLYLDLAALLTLLSGVILLGISIFKVLTKKDSSTWEMKTVSGSIFKDKLELLIFILSVLNYIFFLFLLTEYQYSHYFLLPFIVAIVGMAYTLSKEKKVTQIKLFDKIDLPILTTIVILTLSLSSLSLSSWYFSSIGDEDAFYSTALRILNGPTINIFSYSGAHNKFPIADSYYTALFLWLLGPSLWAWKLSCIAVHAASSSLVYLFGKLLYDRYVGISAALILTFSHYFMAFDKIGYNNTHMCLSSTVALFLLVSSYKLGSRLLLFSAGLMCGLLSYSIWSGLLIIPVVLSIQFLFAIKAKTILASLTNFSYFVFGLVLTILPGLIIHSPAKITSIALALNHGRDPINNTEMGSAVLTSFLAFFFNRWWGSHYVYGSLLDPISGALLLIGIALLLYRAFSSESIVLLVWILVAFFGTIVLSKSNSPYITRLIILLPPLSIVAGRAASIIINQLDSRSLRTGLIVSLALGILTLNLQQLYIGTPLRYPLYKNRHFIKEAQSTTSGIVVVICEGKTRDEKLDKLLKMYAPNGLLVQVISEEIIKNAIVNKDTAALIPNGSKIIALDKLRYLLDQLKVSGDISGPIFKIYAEPYGDNLVVANTKTMKVSPFFPSYIPRELDLISKTI